MASFDQGARAATFIANAEKTMNKFSFFGGGSKYEDAAELFQKGGNLYKVAQDYQSAGDAYSKAAELYESKLQSAHEASAALMNAGNCYKEVNPPAAIQAFRRAVSHWVEAGRFNQAAKITRDIADMYEKDGNAPEAIENYTQAATFFQTENANSQKNACLSKVAELCSAALDPPDLKRAAGIYEKLGRECLDSNLVKYNAKGHFVCAIFCLLALGDSVAARMKLESFGAIDFSFGDSREGKLCSELVQACDDFDADAIATACFEYDRVSKLDGWKTSILVKIKRSIANDGNDDDDEVDLS